jgi:hypothetical protein
MQFAFAFVPPSQTPMAAPVGDGDGRKSGSAVGIGLELFGLVLSVKPLKPSSSPSTSG